MKMDFNKTYYKVTNEKENHHGLQYKTGLIEDILPFNDDKSKGCGEGRIYFTDLKQLPLFFNYRCWIRPLTIPKDALFIKRKYKIGANKVLMKDRLSYKEYFETLFDPETFNWDYSDCLAQSCFEHFDKWFNPETFNWRYSHYLLEFCYKYKHIWGK